MTDLYGPDGYFQRFTRMAKAVRDAADKVRPKPERYITVWRKPPPDVLDWDFHISESKDDVETVVRNITKQGVRQYGTYPLGERVTNLSSEY